MKKKIYMTLSKVVDLYTHSVADSLSLNIAIFKTQALVLKSNTYGGIDILNLVASFNQKVAEQCDDLLEKIKNLFAESGRSLSKKQYDDLKTKCTNIFIREIDAFEKAFRAEFEWTSSIETSIMVSKGKTISKIHNRIDTFKLMTSIRLDKALWWTALGTIFAGTSLILSIVAILISLFI